MGDLAAGALTRYWTITDRNFMRVLYELLVIFSILAFLFYGLSVLFSNAMAEEFKRYGLTRFRRLTGLLEVLGALGLALGYVAPGLTIAASGGLARRWPRALSCASAPAISAAQALQAFGMLLVNLVIFVFAIRFAGVQVRTRRTVGLDSMIGIERAGAVTTIELRRPSGAMR
jgi:hypothetical protein